MRHSFIFLIAFLPIHLLHAQTVSADFEYMDLSVDPSSDFYQYANGTWLKNNPVPESETRYGSFNEVSDHNNEVLKSILESASTMGAKKGETHQLIGDLYHSIMDTTQRMKAGTSSLSPHLSKIRSCKNKSDLTSLLAALHAEGFSAFFGIGVEQDLKINTKHALYVSQSGLGLPNKDYYLKETDHYSSLRTKYIQHIAGMFQLSGSSATAEDVMKLETAMAEHMMGPVELRNIQLQYNKVALDSLSRLLPAIHWPVYFSQMGVEAPDSVIIGQPAYLVALNELLSETPLDELHAYLEWKAVSKAGKYLTPEMERQQFEFYGKALRGQQAMKDPWKNAIDIINRTPLSEALGKAFVEKAFSQEAKDKVYKMVDDLMAAYRERIEGLAWMTPDTRKAALHKLENFSRKLGFPNKWKDFSALDITRDNLLSNILACERFEIKENLSKLNQPIDKEKWEMPPHIVNAYYNPLLNEIVFPAGILQPPFFDPNAEDAVNYARMGAVIGHELTHGFDDQGAQFTADGRFNNWWQEEDLVQFQSRTQKLVNQYNNFQPIPGVFVNGKLTLGENIADFGGLTIAYYAYLRTLKGKKKDKINGFTPEQRFFIAFAQIWKNNSTEQALRHQVDTDPHSPAKYRVNGTLSNMPEFFKAFDIKAGTPMRQPDENIAVIW